MTEVAPTVGSIRVTTTTTGGRVDRNGFELQVDTLRTTIGANTSITIPNVTPGSVVITLGDVESNCVLHTENPQTVSVVAGETANVAWTLTCQRQLLLRSSTGAATGPDLYVINEDGSGLRNLTNLATADVLGAWSPDGERIAFSSDRDGNREIYVMNADGSSPSRLTTDPGVDETPAWSPDGSDIMFRSNRDGNGELYVVASTGGTPRNVTMHPAADFHSRIGAWKADGSRIAFYSDRNGNWDVFTADPDGSNVTPVTSAPSSDVGGAWSPIGEEIVFRTDRQGVNDFFVTTNVRTGVLDLTRQMSAQVGSIRWKPDGTGFLLSARPGTETYLDVFTVNADGSGLQNLTDDQSVHNGSPRLSFDGERIVFQLFSASEDAIFLMNADGSGLTRLIDDFTALDWRP